MKTPPIAAPPRGMRNPAEPPGPARRPGPATLPRPLRLLLVDDSAAVRVTTGMLLRSHGFGVVEAGSGDEAIAQYRMLAGTIDLVLLDMQMPGRDGLETLRALQAFDGGVRVAIVSGAGRSGRVEQALCEGALAFVPKPSSLDVLLEAIARWTQPARGSALRAMAG